MPIVTSLKKIKDQLMTRFYSKSNEPEEWCGTICPKIRKKLDKNIDWSNNYEALPAAKHLFKVIGLFAEYEVDIKKMECSCRAWQLSGIPCRHACACLRHERIKPEDVVNKCYSIEAFKLAYGQVIMPCRDPKVWKKMYGPPMRPPKFDKQVGRPSKKRKKNPLEEDDGTRMSKHGIIGHCSVCNEPGHNRRKCPRLGRGPQATEIPVEEAAEIPVEEAAEILEVQPDPIQVVYANEEEEAETWKKLPVKRRTSSKKKVLPHMGTTASSVVSSTVDISNSSVIQVLQDQAIATQQSQAPLPGPLPENQFIASCRDDLPPPSTRTTASTLGLKRRKVVPKTKENKVP